MKSLNSLFHRYAIYDIAQKIGYKNIKFVPKLKSVHLTLFVNDKKVSDAWLYWIFCYIYLWILTGQKPMRITAKKSLASFKIVEGDKLGLSVCLRKHQAFQFLDCFLDEGIASISDKNPEFEGFIAKAFSQNYTLGFSSLPIFSCISTLINLSKTYYSVHPGFAISLTLKNESKYKNLWVSALHFPIV